MRKFFILLLIFVCLLTGCSKNYTDEEIGELLGTDGLPYEYYQASFVINESDLIEITTYVDYVFVGKVTGYTQTIYNDEMIYTYYTVAIEENIKGELKQDEGIVIVKSGGITKDHKKFELCQGDILPKVGDTYIFCSSVMESIDELYCFGPNTVCQIVQVDNWQEDAEYLKYRDSLKTTASDIYEGKHIVSRYDVNYSKTK